MGPADYLNPARHLAPLKDPVLMEETNGFSAVEKRGQGRAPTSGEGHPRFPITKDDVLIYTRVLGHPEMAK